MISTKTCWLLLMTGHIDPTKLDISMLNTMSPNILAGLVPVEQQPLLRSKLAATLAELTMPVITGTSSTSYFLFRVGRW
ncbi:Hypothetical predicted protein [Podarcis lilfordi]|uniref:Uncharacterized protein n=1 Tax=Podarcis lilfordi TaxID=74358 RepID=A0AA35JQC4_9SAUR|nr:Hypothetical predicted protein [Podarcis lilfordi]